MTLSLNGTDLVEGRDYKVTGVEGESPYMTIKVEGEGEYGGSAKGSLYTYKFDRLWGQNAYDTMKAIVDSGWSADGCDYVVVATGDSYYDALSASGLAGLYGAPIVTTPGGYLGAQAKEEIQRLKPTHLVVMGGPAAVSDATLTSLQGLVSDPKNVTRVWGQMAQATACASYEQNVGKWGDTCVAATFVDSTTR